MSDSNRLRNYAIGLIAGLLLAVSVGYPLWDSATELDKAILRQAHTASEEANSGNVAVREESAAIASVPEQQQCIREEADPYRETERNERDLEAQQIMANWTRVMGKSAIIGMGVGIVGLFLIFTTFWETRKAAENSGKTLRAYINKERALLVPKHAKRQNVHAHGLPGFIVEFENIGNSPATISKVSWSYVSDFLNWPEQFQMTEDMSEPIGLEGGETKVLHWTDDLVMQKPKYLAGLATYTTLTGEAFKTPFSFALELIEEQDLNTSVWRTEKVAMLGMPSHT